MAKKNKPSKKHRFKYAEPTASSAAPAVSASQQAVPGKKVAPAPAAAVAVGRDFSYVGTDLRRLAVLAVALVALELGLSYALGHTSLGTTVYNLIQV